jgi:hypothetical protein
VRFIGLIIIVLSSFFQLKAQNDSISKPTPLQKNILAVSVSTGFIDLSPTVQMALDPNFPKNTAFAHHLPFNINTTFSVSSNFNVGIEYGFSSLSVLYPTVSGFTDRINVKNYRVMPFISHKLKQSRDSKMVFFASLGSGARLSKIFRPNSGNSIGEELFPIIYCKLGMYNEIKNNLRLYAQIGTGAPFLSMGLNF